MELRRLSLYMALLMLAICSQSCSDAHSMHRRGADDGDYDEDVPMGDESPYEETQNDADGGSDGDENLPSEVITTQPTHYNVSMGGSVRLNCKVEPDNRPVVQWSKDGQPLFMGNVTFPSLKTIDHWERITISGSDHDLLISDVRPSDGGKYRCQVLQFNPTMIEHELTVLEPPRITSFTANKEVVLEGSDLELTCNVVGSPPPQIIWSTEGDNGMNSRLQEKDATFTLNTVLIKNIRPEQAGKYYCYAINTHGHTQAEITVRVLPKLRVHVHKTVVNSAIGMEAILQCSAHGEPTPRITWYKDGNVIDRSSRHFAITTNGHHSNLTVTPAVDQDFGTFTCEAQNHHSKHNKSIELVQRPVVEDLDLEGNKLSWRVHSHQPLEKVELQLRSSDGKSSVINVPILESKEHEHEFVYVLDNFDQGTYEVVVKAKNSKEWSRANELVVNYEVPLPIQTASVYHGTGHSSRPAASAIASTVVMYLLMRLF